MTTYFAPNIATSSKILFPIWNTLEDDINAANNPPSDVDSGISVSNASVGVLSVTLGTATAVSIRFWGIPRRSTGWFVLQDSDVADIDVNSLILVDLSAVERFYCEVTSTNGTVTINFGGSV